MNNKKTRGGISTTTALVAALSVGSADAVQAADGATLYQEKVCHSCHGANPDEPTIPAYPKLAGQNAVYSLQQMKDIRDGRRTNGLSIAMKAVVGSVTDEEFQIIAEWLQTQ
ncbi:c-type cytochrome [Thiocapsa rosea]|uniref:Cytochrome c n=1 Tax=Thiocapsa rosea TaxID=69360 RepID=A0A495VEA2_9GAMM|nr:cytochrome c [Thiocapsa rosea]RKT47140.1 cytochrome c [Thiocapsa rosea]